MKKLVLANVALALLVAAGCSSGSSETCGTGTVNQNGTCVAVAVDGGPTVTCGAGTTLVDGKCVANDAGPGIACGAGTMLVNGECMAMDAGPGITCGDGTALDGGECFAKDAGPSTTVAVTMVGLGTGTITGSGVTCGADRTCTATVLEGTSVELTAVADPGYAFVGWKGGGCSGTGTCKVTATGYATLKAGFAAATFWSNGIFATSLNGGPTQQVVAPKDPAVEANGDYAVSADGMTLAFNASIGSGSPAVWVLDYWAGDARPIFPSASWGAVGASISPDGSTIAFVSRPLSFGPGANLLYTEHTDGTALAQVTSYSPTTNDCYNANCATTRFVAWSPDGSKVAWVGNQSTAADGANQAYSNVWVAQADGSNATRLTDFNVMSAMSDPRVAGLDWSPDGSKIAFVSYQDPGANRTGANGVTVSNLWTVDVSTKALFCVTNFTTEYSLDMATYARTGHALVFSSVQDPALGTGMAGRNLFTIADDGTGLRALSSAKSTSAFSAGQYWHPDGKTLLFESNMDPTDATKTTNELGLWSVTLDSSAPTRVNYTSGVWDYTPLDDND